MTKFSIDSEPVCHGCMNKLSENDYNGGGGFTTHHFFIAKNGKEYVSPPNSYIEELSRYNTVLQNDYIIQTTSRLTCLSGEPLPVPLEIQKLCNVLNAGYNK